jgi:YggT family protein
MSAIHVIVKGVLQFLLVTAFILRFVLPLARVNMREQLSQAVIRVTNPIVLPLRKVLPPIGRIDTASLAALLLVQTAVTGVRWLLQDPEVLLRGSFLSAVVFTLAAAIINFYIFALIIYAVLSWVSPGTYSPATSLLTGICEPLLRPIRQLIPPLGGIDFSAFFAMLGLVALSTLF